MAHCQSRHVQSQPRHLQRVCQKVKRKINEWRQRWQKGNYMVRLKPTRPQASLESETTRESMLRHEEAARQTKGNSPSGHTGSRRSRSSTWVSLRIHHGRTGPPQRRAGTLPPVAVHRARALPACTEQTSLVTPPEQTTMLCSMAAPTQCPVRVAEQTRGRTPSWAAARFQRRAPASRGGARVRTRARVRTGAHPSARVRCTHEGPASSHP